MIFVYRLQRISNTEGSAIVMYFCLTGIPIKRHARCPSRVPSEEFRRAKLMLYELEEVMRPDDAEEVSLKLGLPQQKIKVVKHQCKGNLREQINQIIEEVLLCRSDGISPTEILHVLLSTGNQEYTDIALRCHEKSFFGREPQDGEIKLSNTNDAKKTVKRKSFEINI